jgi:hypothetical protein
MCIYQSKIWFVAGLSLAYLMSLSSASAQPVVLDDQLLNEVTAGAEANSSPGGSGGAIIGNSSEATISQTGGIDLSGEAQSGAKGLNIVNSAESTVANGINIWDVNSVDANAGSGQTQVDQSNVINQEQRRSASMPNYSRPEADTFVEVIRTGSESHNNSLDRDNNVFDIQALTGDKTTKTSAWVDTTIKGGANVGDDTLPRGNIDTNVGKGGAGAGIVSLGVDGGEAQIGLAVGGTVIAHPDVVTELSDGTSDSYGGMDVNGADLSLYGRLILPDVTIEINGAGCGVAMGSCGAGGETTDVTSNTTDNSIMDNEVVTGIGDSQFSENLTEVYRSPFELNNAQAEYIVVDDSSLAVNTTFNLTLSGSAQSNVSAMNVVNATGSAVANGINIARTSGLANGGAMALQQSNVISHSR